MTQAQVNTGKFKIIIQKLFYNKVKQMLYQYQNVYIQTSMYTNACIWLHTYFCMHVSAWIAKYYPPATVTAITIQIIPKCNSYPNLAYNKILMLQFPLLFKANGFIRRQNKNGEKVKEKRGYFVRQRFLAKRM